MKKLLPLITFVVIAVALTGCETVPQKGLLITRFQDIKPNDKPPGFDLFGPGEVPSVYVYGYDNQTVTVEIFDIATGELIKKNTSYIPQGKDYYWMFSDLKAGSYKAIISVSGASTDMKLFNVRK